MKKTLAIALCCITVLFAACKKEKPNEKFLGDYKGTAIINGTLSATTPIGQQSQDFNDISIAVTSTVAAGDADNKIVMTIKPDDQNETLTAYGTISNTSVTFEPITFDRTIDTLNTTATIKATLNMTGNLNATTLSLQGDVQGSGSVPFSGIEMPFTVAGNMTSTLNKIIATE